MIRIKKSQTADTRTCDWSKVTKDELLSATNQHIEDVRKGLNLLARLLNQVGVDHDRTKVSHIDQFHADFKTGFKNTEWWEMHQKEERHHFNTLEFIQDDVNLIDVLEQIVDGVMAGMARSGQYRCEPLSNDLLQKAYANTAKLLLANVVVKGNAPGYDRGWSDCYQDRCENMPLGSLGEDRNTIPNYIPEVERAGWLDGYQAMATQLYGENWKKAEFTWKPVLTIRKG